MKKENGNFVFRLRNKPGTKLPLFEAPSYHFQHISIKNQTETSKTITQFSNTFDERNKNQKFYDKNIKYIKEKNETKKTDFFFSRFSRNIEQSKSNLSFISTGITVILISDRIQINFIKVYTSRDHHIFSDGIYCMSKNVLAFNNKQQRREKKKKITHMFHLFHNISI